MVLFLYHTGFTAFCLSITVMMPGSGQEMDRCRARISYQEGTSNNSVSPLNGPLLNRVDS